MQIPKTFHPNIQPYLAEQTSIWLDGFCDAVWYNRPKAPAFNRDEYIEGYADGSMYHAEMSGIAVSTKLRRVGD